MISNASALPPRLLHRSTLVVISLHKGYYIAQRRLIHSLTRFVTERRRPSCSDKDTDSVADGPEGEKVKMVVVLEECER